MLLFSVIPQRATVSERAWFRFLLVLCVVVCLGLGGVAGTLVVSAASDEPYGKPLKFAPPPVDLDFNSEGAVPSEPVKQAPSSSVPPVERSSRSGESSRGGSRSVGGTPSPARSQALEVAEVDTPPAEGRVATANGSNSTAGTGETTEKDPKSAKGVRLFGTVEFRSVLKNLPKWERVLHAESKQPTFGKAGQMPDNVRKRWEKLAGELEGKPLMEQAQKVNTFFNQWPYKTDMAVWGVEDYWALPSEFMIKSGDCEDYAISKYYALRSLGVPAKNLRIAVVMDSIRQLGHAILIVYIDDKAYVLDNLTNLVLSHQKLSHYVPQYSVNEEYLWRHIRPVNK